MIFAKPTEFNAGLTIYGDYADFTSLHTSIHEIADEKNNLGEIGEYISGLVTRFAMLTRATG